MAAMRSKVQEETVGDTWKKETEGLKQIRKTRSSRMRRKTTNEKGASETEGEKITKGRGYLVKLGIELMREKKPSSYS
jgi:hypothetical protein